MKEEIKLTKEQEKKIIAKVETKIISMLLHAQNSRISDGYYGWHVSRYQSFIWQFAFLNELETDFVDAACKSLLKKNFIRVGESEEREKVFIELTKQYFVSQI